ncbi:Cof-type HAD-IIB family hydrolase [Enterococcus sp. HY326]|uniref:Cof-type HAD-IIB family hydrolase n=1 Tax=Enterococcus sp. HY326 TaxID=2971265 RepID=UPI00224079F7|nr:Cof-type HAD-IIB family hydrolase [Enterococcus sp. HY326]
MKKLIAIDLDGTTLNTDSQVSPRTAAVLEKAKRAGHTVTIATGRPYRMSEHIYSQLKLTSPMINFNGALIHLPHQVWSGELETLINRDIAFEILAQKQQLNLDFVAAENKNSFYIDTLDNFDGNFFASEKASEKNILSAKNMTTNPNSLLLRVNNPDSLSVSEQLVKDYGDYVEVNTWGGPNPILEVVAKGIQKAKGVSHVADLLGFQQEDIIAFGDEHNDVEMLDYAGWGVAMANGTDQVKAVANDVTEKTNGEDGLADYLEKYLELN